MMMWILLAALMVGLIGGTVLGAMAKAADYDAETEDFFAELEREQRRLIGRRK